jgi:ribosomal protein S18 acetylase RimI-like enzyme
MASEPSFRPATEQDGNDLEALERDVWDVSTAPDPSYEGPVFGVRIPYANVIVAALDERVVGYVALGRRTPFAANAHVGLVRSLAVAPTVRRRGVARGLLERAVQTARSSGQSTLRLTVMGSNAAALALYLSAGFVECGRFVGEFRVGDQLVDDVLLSKLL